LAGIRRPAEAPGQGWRSHERSELGLDAEIGPARGPMGLRNERRAAAPIGVLVE